MLEIREFQRRGPGRYASGSRLGGGGGGGGGGAVRGAGSVGSVRIRAGERRSGTTSATR